MNSSKTSSASGANCCRLAITESYGVARSSLGTPSRAPRDSNGDVTPAAPARSRNVNLTVPSKGYWRSADTSTGNSGLVPNVR